MVSQCTQTLYQTSFRDICLKVVPSCHRLFLVSMTWSTFVLCSILPAFCFGGRILLLTVPGRSHIHYVATAGKELAVKGHEVHIVLPTSGEESIKTFSKLIDSSLTIQHPKEIDGHTNVFENEEELSETFKTILHMIHTLKIPNTMMFRISGFMMKDICYNLLKDQDLFVKLKEKHFDIALIDGFPATRCQYVFLHRLGIPYVSLTTQYEPWRYGIPALPSFVPLAIEHDFSEKMTFFQRLRNFLSYVEWQTMPLVETMSGHYTSDFAPEMPYKSPNQLASESALWFINTDIALDYPRPSLPHVIEVGGLTTKAPTEPLPKDFQTFMDNSGDDGVILVSFGSSPGFPDQLEQLIHDTVLKLNRHVIWKTTQHNLTSATVITSKWIPQNSIMAHPKVKLFITHGGNNGQFEALYHAVPMIVIPLFGDQFYNSQRIQYKGYGIAKEAFGMTVDELIEAINEVTTNPSYKENILRGSKVYKSHPMNPRERLVYWMEHVMEYGSDHLHSYSLEMPWYQYWMIDVLVFVLICSLIVIAGLYSCCKSVFRCFGKRSRKTKLNE